MVSDEFEVLELIGRGSFGQIRKVRRKSDNAILVRKEISYKAMNAKEKSQLIAEFRILKSLVHPNIVQYFHHEHVSDEHVVHLYMEYCGGGDLADLIRQCRESGEYVPEDVVWSVFTQLILALYRCHYNTDPPAPGDLFSTRGPNGEPVDSPPIPSTVILHRDIKPDNVFLDGDTCVKLGDFGLAKMLDQENILANTYVGTPFYMSPEVLMDQPYTPQSDVWSLGCVIYELCALHPPFQAKSHLALSQKIREGQFPALPDCYSSTLARTIAACININPLARPTTATLLSLDVIKLCRKDRELTDAQRQLGAIEEELRRRETQLADREVQLMQEFEAYKVELEHEFYNKLERELSGAIDREVDRRVEIVLRQQQQQQQQQQQHSSQLLNAPTSPKAPPSPSDTSMASPLSPTLGRNVRGPRSIRDNIISPLRESRPFDNMANRQFVPSSPLHTYTSAATIAPEGSSSSSSSTTSLASGSSATSATSSNSNTNTVTSASSSIGGYTSNWQTTKKDTPKIPAYLARGQGQGVAAKKILGMPRSGPERLWDEAIHGDDMPSPFLKRTELKRSL